ncbi:iron/manganese ABC transporter permease subunit YfeD [Yersinia massiliensis]|jgi:manganese/iron transport system permease protein|uniref:Iron/manganese ABC transporter permease subunit YfeD n=2 Tax=Yersinia TaxID=629 RepID=A0A2R4NPI2_9GAMM|nr:MULTISPECIES: iron/manganese ABC transporter permease subunit YfeD [Yersinia]HEC1649180.1 iron/manganese ABC transporter permease subunit YfeD [Yersinia enterocolitica]ATM86081.1 metal ABC transporter permease [Yersinia frederiksenii]AVX38033.1 metal ABC transporter permease [Yersinia massiliensis]MCB5317426.1 iron/manganese ABC transporter permease subunit YfeD [Yersinia massiliensis]MDA5548385.1 iron/manganese ABC transporter permease subunit YfeD [Yersinia massiliensis]
MNTLFSLISDPFAYPFMQRAIVAAIITGVVCAVLSCYLVLKGWSLMGDAISHAVLPGIVLAFWLGIPLVIGAFVSGIFCAVATGYLKENSRVKEDTVMGIVFSGMFAFGIVLFSRMDTDQHLSHILFGNMLGISLAELKQTLWIAGFTLLVVLLKRKDFMLYCFDPNHARVIGLPVKFLHYGLLCLLALTIVASLQAVGVILVIAMLIAPGIIAFMICRSFDRMLIVATLVSVVSCVLGTLISFHIDGATGPCIVIIQALFFVVALIYSHFKPVQGRQIPQQNKPDSAENAPKGNLL